MLAHLGTPVGSRKDVDRALLAAELDRWNRLCEPVATVRGRRKGWLPIRTSERHGSGGFRLRIVLESGDVRVRSGTLADLPTVGRRRFGGQRFVEKRLPVGEVLPFGYHRIEIEVGGRREQALLICAPRRAWVPEEPGWGIFAPVYALPGERGPGVGDLSSLQELIEWTASLGGRVVGTLPLLAAFLDEPFDPSPYAPASRLFWNEIYVDLERLPELARCEGARRLLASPGFTEESALLRAAPLVDYRRIMALKRPVLRELARCCFAGESRRALEAWVQSHPRAEDYARFRAVLEAFRLPWPRWSEPLRSGRIEPSDYREEDRRYHLYVQWRIAEQMADVVRNSRSLGVGVYLDLPLGVHPAGYDVWREREVFVEACSLGAPPDVVYPEGQRWGVAPVHPRAQRLQGYRYLIDCIRHHLGSAGALRIDHVMGIHRVWCVPDGLPPGQGAYLSYPHDEVYAILALESHRHRSFLVGEDLGTVPTAVREGMRQNGLLRMHVLQYELEGGRKDPMAKVPRNAVASVNTHDFSPFAAWWHEQDVDDRLFRGHLDAEGAQAVRAERRRGRSIVLGRLGAGRTLSDLDILARILECYAASAAPWLIVNLEDLWLEREPQNTPGTGDERPNWRRKLRYRLDEIRDMPRVRAVLRRIQSARRRAANRGG